MIKPIVVKDESTLRAAVKRAINTYGPAVDLNAIDVSKVENFDGLFKDTRFCGDISRWNMARAKSAVEMFAGTPFNGDVSQWDVGTLIRIGKTNGMFDNQHFAQDLSSWHIGDVREKLQATVRDMLTKHPALSSAVTGHDKALGTFSPNQQRALSVGEYTKLFGDDTKFGAYLARAPFGTMHFDVCCINDICPIGIRPEDHEWSRNLFTAGTGLGLDTIGLRAMCMAQLVMRGQHGVEMVPLDDLWAKELN